MDILRKNGCIFVLANGDDLRNVAERNFDNQTTKVFPKWDVSKRHQHLIKVNIEKT